MTSKRGLWLAMIIIGTIAGFAAWQGDFGVAGSLAGLISTMTLKMFEKNES